MKFDKASKHEAYLNVLEIKNVTRDITGGRRGWRCWFVCAGGIGWRLVRSAEFVSKSLTLHPSVSSAAKSVRHITEEDNGKFVPVIAFECRGLEPVAYHPEVRPGCLRWGCIRACTCVCWVHVYICEERAPGCTTAHNRQRFDSSALPPRNASAQPPKSAAARRTSGPPSASAARGLRTST
jgi:hypothetical protein